MLEKFFHLSERKTNVRTELIAGLTTFMAMAYILAVNPNILGDSGMNTQAILIATALTGAFGCIAMGLLANFPMCINASLGVNAFFAFSICQTMGMPWQYGLLVCFSEGVVFTILTLTGVSEKIFKAIPDMLKVGITVGVGLFIGFVGLQNSYTVVANDSTLVQMVEHADNFSEVGICSLFALLGFVLLAVLEHKKVKGSFLIAVFSIWILAIICQFTGIYQGPSVLPNFASFEITAIGETFMAFTDPVAFENFDVVQFIMLVFSLLLVHIFSTIGSIIAAADKGGFLDKKDNSKGIKKALLADSLATVFGSAFGCSSTTIYVESVSGITAGGRTGLTSVTTGVMFLLSLVLSPLFIAIPNFATTPVMLYVAFLMLGSLKSIDFGNIPEAVPAVLATILMPLTYSIPDGIAIGLISYVLINLFCGRGKKVSPLLYVLGILFLLKYIFI